LDTHNYSLLMDWRDVFWRSAKRAVLFTPFRAKTERRRLVCSGGLVDNGTFHALLPRDHSRAAFFRGFHRNILGTVDVDEDRVGTGVSSVSDHGGTQAVEAALRVYSSCFRRRRRRSAVSQTDHFLAFTTETQSSQSKFQNSNFGFRIFPTRRSPRLSLENCG
jgi:hypothetical protein